MVHLYTATGVAVAFLTVVAVIEGDTVEALWLGLVAMVVDGTDGMLARHLQVKKRVPWFDGALLDNIVDYLTYAFTPMVLLWSAGYLGEGTSATVLAVIPLLASAYQFCRVDAKTDDHLFLGFPSYWNIAAFYVVVLDLQPVSVAIVLLGLRGPGVRPDRLRLPLAHRPAAPDHPRADHRLARELRRAPGPAPGPRPGLAGDLARLRRLLRGPQPLPDGPALARDRLTRT